MIGSHRLWVDDCHIPEHIDNTASSTHYSEADYFQVLPNDGTDRQAVTCSVCIALGWLWLRIISVGLYCLSVDDLVMFQVGLDLHNIMISNLKVSDIIMSANKVILLLCFVCVLAEFLKKKHCS